MALLLEHFPIFLLYFCRITAFFVVAPVFSSKGVPNQFKVGIAFFVTLITYLTVGIHQTAEINPAFLVTVINELLVGLLLGFTAYIFFTTVQVAGSFIDMQMGFGIANIIDPMSGIQSPIIGNLKFMIAILLFLSMNGHHYLLLSLMRSYEWVPIHNSLFAHIQHENISNFLLTTFSRTFSLAFQMAAPLVMAMFLVDLAMGILARTVPQLNIFVVGMPIKVIVGLMMLIIVTTGFLALFQNLFKSMFDSINQLLQIMNGPIH